jgi:hypothetical protein
VAGARRRFGLTSLVVVATVIAGGCQYLLGIDPNDPGFTEPAPVEAYHGGRATVTVGSEPAIVLDELTMPGTFDAAWGAEASFRNADGWYVRVSGATTGGGILGEIAYLQIDRIVDSQHWTTWDPSRCIVTIEAVDEKVLRGKASCKGLRWSDALGLGGVSIEPTYIDGQDPFDAEITFEATAAPTQQS